MTQYMLHFMSVYYNCRNNDTLRYDVENLLQTYDDVSAHQFWRSFEACHALFGRNFKLELTTVSENRDRYNR